MLACGRSGPASCLWGHGHAQKRAAGARTVLECDARAAGELSIRPPTTKPSATSSTARLKPETERKVNRGRGGSRPGEGGGLSDRLPELRCVMRAQSRDPPPPPRPQTLTLPRLQSRNPYITRSPEPALPAGKRTYLGGIAAGQRPCGAARAKSDLSILLRKDTRYLKDGQLVEAGQLQPTMRVFVRAGKDVYEQVEAYQVIWGTILTPR